MSSERLLHEAQRQARKAVERAIAADNAGNVPEAVHNYSTACELLLAIVRRLPDEGTKQPYITAMQQYLARAEVLRGISGTDAVVAARKARIKPADAHEAAVLDEVLDHSPGVRWSDVAGLRGAKQLLQEAVILPMLRPDLFRGIRSPPRGVLLFGPPGTGKTLLAKAVATESNATFFCMSASALTSKYLGEGEKLVRALFSVARKMQPSVVFVDELDSLLKKRGSDDHDASRRIKTEFLVQMDGASTSESDRVLVLGATNIPQELDDAVIRRMPRRVYVPLPDAAGREALIRHALKDQASLSEDGIRSMVAATEGFSGSDLAALCRDAAMGPLRELGAAVATVRPEDVRKVLLRDLQASMSRVRPSTTQEAVEEVRRWSERFGETPAEEASFAEGVGAASAGPPPPLRAPGDDADAAAACGGDRAARDAGRQAEAMPSAPAGPVRAAGSPGHARRAVPAGSVQDRCRMS